MNIIVLTTASLSALDKSIFYYLTTRNREDRQQLYDFLTFKVSTKTELCTNKQKDRYF